MKTARGDWYIVLAALAILIVRQWLESEPSECQHPFARLAYPITTSDNHLTDNAPPRLFVDPLLIPLGFLFGSE